MRTAPSPITLAQDRCDLEVLSKTGRQVEFTKSLADLLIPYLDLLFYAPSYKFCCYIARYYVKKHVGLGA